MNNMNNNPNSHPTGPVGATGSITDTIKTYVNNAFEQAKVLGHKAQEQLYAMANTGAHPQDGTHPNQQSDAYPGSHATSQSDTMGGNLNNRDNNAFADLHKFSAESDQHNQATNAGYNAASNACYKSSQSGL
ncbi:hypothetical protein BG011_007091 [Mortierella polycephala]|uniref:Uncharacterized protein n=1 Tax=Mortierella polycephala TaxID=41804 RepID=A0A9P6PRV8_9FUNG|nr:hypothetical protein BG011_007091 [Mortierella polycephala]